MGATVFCRENTCKKSIPREHCKIDPIETSEIVFQVGNTFVGLVLNLFLPKEEKPLVRRAVWIVFRIACWKHTINSLA